MDGGELFRHHMKEFFENVHKVCNETVLSLSPPDDGLYCPAVLDNFGLCFNYTKAGTIAYMPCPVLFVPNPNAISFRRCESNGEWQIFDNGKPWTNISSCTHNITHPYYHTQEGVYAVSYVYLYIAVASLSLVLLILSMAIFFGFRQLRCDRITIHKNLFVSYILSSFTWILYYKLTVLDGFVLLRNPVCSVSAIWPRSKYIYWTHSIEEFGRVAKDRVVWCQLLNILAQAFTATSYSWMFCEGLYLHIIMAHALRTGKKLTKCLVIGGWIVPLVLTAIYGTVRWATYQQTQSCWIHEDQLQWIVAAPICASAIINICILVNLIRLLMTKLKQIPEAPQRRQAAKATLILVPLLGLQFLVFPVRPNVDSQLYVAYLYIMAFLQSSQGTMVSIIFCFCNGEVRSLIRRKWRQYKLMSEGGKKATGVTSSTIVDGYSMVDSTREGSCLRHKDTYDNQHKNVDSVEMKGSPVATTPLVKKNNYADTTDNHTDDSVA